MATINGVVTDIVGKNWGEIGLAVESSFRQFQVRGRRHAELSLNVAEYSGIYQSMADVCRPTAGVTVEGSLLGSMIQVLVEHGHRVEASLGSADHFEELDGMTLTFTEKAPIKV